MLWPKPAVYCGRGDRVCWISSAASLRCAVTLSAMSETNAELATVCFPAEFAGLKDRPYYDEVIQRLQKAADEDKKEAARD